MLQQASEAVASILDEDPDLAMESHAILQRKMDQFLEDKIDRMNL